MAYMGGHEHTAARVKGEPASTCRRFTKLIGAGEGPSKLVHRHAETLPSQIGAGVWVGR
ncbi:MAG: hypothetical protein QOF92_4396 [Pseudonocardiales bacterium]|jgi:hypothetical protein|nr:hypothetical protein [Pseudonocardiales bacterium]